jgi:hypothetical protein
MVRYGVDPGPNGLLAGVGPRWADAEEATDWENKRKGVVGR